MPPPCSLGDPQTKGDEIRSGCLTLAFSGAQKRAEMLCHPCILGDPQTKGDKIGSGCLTSAFSGAQKRAEMLRLPCILGDPQTKGGQNQKWLPHPCLLRGPKEGGSATSPLHSRGSPTKGTKSEVKTYTRGNNDAPSISKYGSSMARHPNSCTARALR